MKTLNRLIPLLALIVLMACSDRELPVKPGLDDSVTIEGFIVPEFLDTDSTYTVAVKVTAEQPLDSVQLVCIDNQTQVPIISFYLYDDGAAVNAKDADVVANDGIFSQVFQWPYPLDEIREIKFAFKGNRNDSTAVGEAEFTAYHFPNIAPQILEISGPDTLKSGFDEPQQFVVTVSDENGDQDIVSVTYTGMRNGELLFSGELEPGTELGTYVLRVDSTFSAEKSGEYILRFIATDQSGSNSLPKTHSLYIENGKPILGELDALSSFNRPPVNETDHFLIQLQVSDPQGLDDIKEVSVSWQKPDGSFGGGSPYELYDNGLEYNYDYWNQGYRGDLVADDGTYSITAVFDGDDVLGNYILIFWAEDRAGNTSDEVIHFITLQ